VTVLSTMRKKKSTYLPQENMNFLTHLFLVVDFSTRPFLLLCHRWKNSNHSVWVSIVYRQWCAKWNL